MYIYIHITIYGLFLNKNAIPFGIFREKLRSFLLPSGVVHTGRDHVHPRWKALYSHGLWTPLRYPPGMTDHRFLDKLNGVFVGKKKGWWFRNRMGETPGLFKNLRNFCKKHWTLNVNLCWTKLNLKFFKSSCLNVSFSRWQKGPFHALAWGICSGSIHLHELYGLHPNWEKKNNNCYFNFIQICELGSRNWNPNKTWKSMEKNHIPENSQTWIIKSFWEGSLTQPQKTTLWLL